MSSSDIKVNIEELNRAARLFDELRNEMDNAIKKANRTLEPVRLMKSERVRKHLNEWEELKRKFVKDLDELVESSKKIEKTGKAFGDVDSAPIN